MPMSDAELTKLFLMLRRPIVWDPIPPWIKPGREISQKFAEVQVRWNAKMAELEQEKIAELGKIIGMKLER